MAVDSSSALSVLVADDEELARDLLRALVSKDAELAWVGECKNGAAALKQVEVLQPDLLLLDIQMPVLNGMRVAQHLAQKPQPPFVVFVTAYDRYAIEAFELNALDYLVKPIEKARFAQAMLRAKRAVRQGMVMQQAEKLLTLGHPHPEPTDAAAKSDNNESLIVQRQNEFLRIEHADIHWVEAANQYVKLHTTQGEVMMAKTLSRFFETLQAPQFLRIHRSAVVNACHVAKVVARPGGTATLVLKTGAELPLARSRRDLIPLLLQFVNNAAEDVAH